MKNKLEKIIDDINWDIAMFLKHSPEKDGIFASLIVPATVAFITAIITVVKFAQ